MRHVFALLLFAASLSAEARVPKPFGELPAAFEDRNGVYVARGPDYSLVLGPSEAAFRLHGSTLKLRLVRANPGAAVSGVDRLAGRANYFHGTALPESFALYSSVIERAVYPGADLIFRANGRRLEYDFEIAGGNPDRISLAFEGADSVRIDERGDLMVTAGGEEIRQPKPIAWQLAGGRKEFVSVSYRVDASLHVSFRLGSYDPRRPLTIDPQVLFDNAFGGNQVTKAASIALDAQGNIYAAGLTGASDFPTLNPVQSKDRNNAATAFVAKWSPGGATLLYSTYLGGSVFDTATTLAVDNSGNAYIAGTTNSPDFPVTANAFQKHLAGASNAFIAKLAPGGSQLIYSTYLGGGSEQMGAIAVDGGGDAIVTGETAGAGFPVTPNAFQSAPVSGCPLGPLPLIGVPPNGAAFVARLTPDGSSLIFSTLLGGVCGTVGQTLALDAGGNIWIAGATASSDFPVTADALQAKFGGGFVDGFLARFDSAGTLAYASYLGGNAYDSIGGIALDQAGDIYIAGVSAGLSQPTSPGAYQQSRTPGCFALGIGPVEIVNNGIAFAARLTPNASAISGLTYLGGGCVRSATVAVDSSGAAWIAGSLLTLQAPYPTVSPIQIGVGTGYLSKLSPDFTQVLFSTYFDEIDGFTLDAAGLPYVAGVVSNKNGYVAKIDPATAAISLDQVVPEGRVGYDQPLAPGQVLRLVGKNLGPANGVPGIVSAGFVTTSVAGVQVNFGGVAAPLLSVSSGEIECVAPFEITGQTTTAIQVQYNGAKSNPVLLPVTAVALELLGVFNEDFTANSASNPAKPGSVMSAYISGAGQTVPASLDGEVNRAPFAQAGMQIQALYYVPAQSGNGANSQSLAVTFAAAAPGAVAGVVQVNFAAPPQSANVVLQAGGSSNQFSVAVQ